MPTTNRLPRPMRILPAALIALGFVGCKAHHATPATQPMALAFGHGGVMANDTNPPFVPSNSSGPVGSIERLDPRLDALVAPEATMEKIIQGLDWSEGPVWDRKAGALLFSDVPQNVIYQWQPGTGIREFARPSGYTGTEPRGGEPGSNGLTIDSLGRLILTMDGDRNISRLEGFLPSDEQHLRRPVTVPLVQKFDGHRFNSPNDLVLDSNGNLYFTDPTYGLVTKDETDPAKEIQFQGVYRLSNKGDLTLLTKELSRPNGIALSPDEKTLYVSNSDPAKAVWMSYPLKEDGTLGPGKVFFDATEIAKDKEILGMPDGMKVDVHGNIFSAGPGGVWVFAPDGTHLGTLHTTQATGNCAWGDDGSTLYICADMYVLRIKTLTKGW